MVKFDYILTDKDGIHARPAGLFVKQATAFKSNISIAKGEKQADAKRLFAIMGLAAKQGDTITVIADGEDENEASASLQEFLKENL